MLSRFGILGDIHAEDARLDRALDVLGAASVDVVLAVGDIVDGPGDVNRCCARLREHNVIAVRGNHERWLLAGAMRDLPDATVISTVDCAAHEYLASLPATRELSTSDGTLLLCHGLGADDMAGVRPDDFGYALRSNDTLHSLVAAGRFRYVVAGHTHHRMVRHFDGLTIVNAGTLYRDHDPCFGLVDLSERVVTFYRASGTVRPDIIQQIGLEVVTGTSS